MNTGKTYLITNFTNNEEIYKGKNYTFTKHVKPLILILKCKSNRFLMEFPSDKSSKYTSEYMEHLTYLHIENDLSLT